jgi:hypothetical protein
LRSVPFECEYDADFVMKQLNAEYDALKQKLRDVQNMLATTDEPGK